MAYFKIDDIDFSSIVSELKVETNALYNAQTNAAGDTVVDYINKKRTIEVGIIHIDEVKMLELQNAIDAFNVSLTFLNPRTNTLEENVNCIISQNAVEYFTIQKDRKLFKASTLVFQEL
jgi:hypothetical protein